MPSDHLTASIPEVDTDKVKKVKNIVQKVDETAPKKRKGNL
jgi:hypothetical protein